MDSASGSLITDNGGGHEALDSGTEEGCSSEKGNDRAQNSARNCDRKNDMHLNLVAQEQNGNTIKYLKTPMSPSRAEEAWFSGNAALDHHIYFDGDTSPAEATFVKIQSQSLRNAQKNSTAKATSPTDDKTSGVNSTLISESMQPSHRAIHRFTPRHYDEIALEVGDPVFLQYEAEDNWCRGINLRTYQVGIFPSVHIFEVDLDGEVLTANKPVPISCLNSAERITFFITYLGSVEVAHHKGNEVVVQAINKTLQIYQNKEEIVIPHAVLLEISYKGIHMIDKASRNWLRYSRFDYFYSLQNISFCGAHPKQLRYFGFITKHPLLPVFACHTFMSKSSTQPIVDAIGRAFQRSYNEYMAFSHPTEDIYLE